MSNSFRFKRFLIEQDGSAMKVGTDGVLLGAWCGVDAGCRRALDIGAGTGVIALMLAQRGESWGLEADGVEIDVPSAAQASRNAAASPWADRVRIHNRSIQEFTIEARGRGERYDLVVSNPPYFVNSLLPPDEARTAARHATRLTYSELLFCASSLMSPRGRFALVLPYEQGEGFNRLASQHGLSLLRITDVCTKPGVAPKRVLIELGAGEHPETERTTLVIEGGEPHGFSAEYAGLTGEFYLKF